MSLADINLIELFTAYLVVAFVLGTILRLRNYQAILALIFSFPKRWPKLLAIVKTYRTLFLQWPTLLPIACAAALMVINWVASRFVWAHARVTPNELMERWLPMAAVVLSGGMMLVLDGQAVFVVRHFNRAALEADLDRAEHWLDTWKAPVLRVLTLGLVNPRKIVNQQVHTAIVKANRIVNGQVWRWATQIGMRVVFGLTLWGTWMAGLSAGS